MAANKQKIPACTGVAARLKKGQTLKVINTHGQQVVDFWAFSAKDVREFMSMEHTRPNIRRLVPTPGDPLVSNHRRTMLKVVKDTTPGVHDTTVAACCPNRYRQLGVTGYHKSCQENLHLALKKLRRVPSEVPCPFNLFQNSQYDRGGELTFTSPTSKAGQFISFKAEMDCIVVFSACPQDIIPVNGENCTPTEAHFAVVG